MTLHAIHPVSYTHLAIGVRNWWLKVNNFDYDATLPELCHQYLEKGKDMAPQAMENLTTLANSVVLDKTPVTDMGVFVNKMCIRDSIYGKRW